MEVRKIMTKNPACCTPDSTLQEVAHLMEMYDCGCIPVVDSHKSLKPTGTITDRDIAIRTFAEGKNPLEMKASDIMTTDIVTVTPETSVQECLKVMEQRQIRRILVVDESGRCTGIVAQADLAEYATGQTAHFLREVSETDSQHDEGFESQDRGFEAYRSTGGENSVRTQNREFFSLNESGETHKEKHHEKHRKPHREKESFFTSKSFLALLGSIGIGAGLRYYFGPETGDKTNRTIKNPQFEYKNADNMKTFDTSKTKTPSVSAPTAETTKSIDTFGSADTTFNKTNDDSDLKPITEVGKTATNN